MTDLQRAVVFGMAKNDMSVTRTARDMHCHHNTVQFHCRQIQKQTGLNPRHFFDLIKLYEMATNEECEEKQTK